MASLDRLTKMSIGAKVGVLLAFMLVAGAGFYFGLYGPLLDDHRNAVQSHEKLKKKLLDVKKRKQTYDDDTARLHELEASAQEQFEALPDDKGMSTFIEDLNAQAELVGLSIEGIKPLEEEPKEYYARIPVQLTLRGGFLQLAKFFYLVANLGRIINMNEIQVPFSRGCDRPSRQQVGHARHAPGPVQTGQSQHDRLGAQRVLAQNAFGFEHDLAALPDRFAG